MADWKIDKGKKTCDACGLVFEDAQEFFSTTAAKHATPTAQVFHAFNGPDGTNDPRDRGLITADGLHPSEAGALLIVETIHDLAYDFAGWPNSSAIWAGPSPAWWSNAAAARALAAL